MAQTRHGSTAQSPLDDAGSPHLDHRVIQKIDDLMKYMAKISVDHREDSVENGPSLLEKAVLDAKNEYKRRRDRENEFNIAGLFADPAWDILLDLFINQHAGKKICTSSACIASCVPITTALRWITALENEGLVCKVSDKTDRRRTFIELTELGMNKMLCYFGKHMT